MPVSPPELHILADPAQTVAEVLADQARRGGSIVLTGGSSVAGAYREAARLEPDWSKVTVWWGDERSVPPEDERSNYRLSKENLLDHPAPAARVTASASYRRPRRPMSLTRA
jgi:6-phosphogluconolactonase